jgi:hypothetical protein
VKLLRYRTGAVWRFGRRRTRRLEGAVLAPADVCDWLVTIVDVERHFLAFAKMIHIGPLYPGNMDKHVFVTSVWSDEAKASLALEKLHGPARPIALVGNQCINSSGFTGGLTAGYNWQVSY